MRSEYHSKKLIALIYNAVLAAHIIWNPKSLQVKWLHSLHAAIMGIAREGTEGQMPPLEIRTNFIK